MNTIASPLEKSSLSTDPLMVDANNQRFTYLYNLAYQQYILGFYQESLQVCEQLYELDTCRIENILLLGAIHFQLGNYSESIFYNQQCIRINTNCSEAYGNLGNALKEIGDSMGAIQFYLKAIQLNPRFSDAYNNLANLYMQMGQIKESMETYQMAIVLNPLMVDAHSNLGNLYKTTGEWEQAKACYLEAIRIQPSFAIAWNNLACLYKDRGEYNIAIEHYQEAIRLAPDCVDAYSNLGNVLKEKGEFNQAMDAYRRAISIRPDFAIAHGNLATALYAAGEIKEAIYSFQHAIQLEPNFPDAYNNLGNALRENQQIEQAIHCYRTALRLKPDHMHAYNNLGNALKDKGMIKEAMHCYATAIRLKPSFPAAHSNLASILKEQGKLDQALSHYQQAISFQPSFADAYSNMGNVFKELNRFEEAIQCYTTAIRFKPTFPDAYSNLASVYKDGGKIQDAITCYRKALSLRPYFPEAFANYYHAMVLICDWETREEDFKTLCMYLNKQLNTTTTILPCIQPFHALNYSLSSQQFLELSKRYAQFSKRNIHSHTPYSKYKNKKQEERLRIGYISSDIGNHPLSHLMKNVFSFHNRKKYEIYLYMTSSDDGSNWRQYITQTTERVIDISTLHPSEAAALIYHDNIHILINLNGYTKGAKNEIFALTPSPLQMSYMGFCGTLGADYIHYLLADSIVIPKSSRPFFSEKILSMPHSYFVNDHQQSALGVLNSNGMKYTREQYLLPENAFVYCNFNQNYKIDPNIFKIWMNILKRVPHSILWLLRFPSSMAEANLRKVAMNYGIKPDRIVFTDVAPKDEHLERGYLADLFLDTPECNAHTTGCDILWSGTPMITMPQERMASRVAASLLTAINVPELITNTLQEYEELAVALAHDMDQLWELRKRIEENRLTCPLFDTKRWVTNMEKGLNMIWERYENGLEPDHIEIIE